MLSKMMRLTLISAVMGDTLEALFWTETNAKFEINPYHEITVRIGDKMDLICPRFDDGMNHNDHFYHRIYEVSEEAFR
jgi:hypothetical protein